MATALLFAWRPLKHNVGVKMLVSVAVFGLATVVFGLSRWMPLSLACLVVLGGADMLSVYVRQSLMQLSTPDAMRGRVGAVSSLFISASNELGEAESGFLAACNRPGAGGGGRRGWRDPGHGALGLVVSGPAPGADLRLQDGADGLDGTTQL
jgi:hypothetical protein